MIRHSCFLLSLACLLCYQSGCTPPPAGVRLTADLARGEWHLQDRTLGGQTVVDRCELDDVLIFLERGDFAWQWGDELCDPVLEAATRIGDWHWREDNVEIRLRYRIDTPQGGPATAFRYLEVALEADTLRLSEWGDEGEAAEEVHIFLRQ